MCASLLRSDILLGKEGVAVSAACPCCSYYCRLDQARRGVKNPVHRLTPTSSHTSDRRSFRFLPWHIFVWNMVEFGWSISKRTLADVRVLSPPACQVLSVIAQQIMTLQGAVQRGEKRVIFEDVRYVIFSRLSFEAEPAHAPCSNSCSRRVFRYEIDCIHYRLLSRTGVTHEKPS